MANNEPTIGDSRKIVGIKPKFYIRDDGTDYTDGEEFNGLWSAGEDDNPTGYGNIAHWKLQEMEGSIGFNNRVRGYTDLFCKGTSWSSDGVTNYLQFMLPNHSPIGDSTSNFFIMVGTGGSKSQTDAWDEFVKVSTNGTSGFDDVRGYEGGRYFFSMWGYFRKPPTTANPIQTLFYLHNEAGNTMDKVLRFCIENVGGNPVLALYNVNTANTTFTKVHSTDAGAAIYPGGSFVDGGLHHIGFVVDRNNLDSGDIVMDQAPYGLWVDGNYYPANVGSTSTWKESLQTVDTNAFIGCEIDGDSPTFTADQEDDFVAPEFVNHFTGKFYSIQLSDPGVYGGTDTVTVERMKMIHGLKFDIPRGPGLVDFSERYEFDGKNLLQEIGKIDQVIGDDKGGFHVNINSVKVRN